MPKQKKKSQPKSVTINGTRYPLEYRDDQGNIKRSPAGKYVDRFGRMKNLPKKKTTKKK